jgi:hypothetical protein
MKNDPRGWYRLLRSPARDSARESVVMERELPDGSVERVRLVRWQVFERWRRRAAIAFVGLVIVSTFAVYLGDHARRAATAGLSAEAQRAIRRSCEDRVDVRITVAAGFDELRRFAIDSGEPDGRGRLANRTDAAGRVGSLGVWLPERRSAIDRTSAALTSPRPPRTSWRSRRSRRSRAGGR